MKMWHSYSAFRRILLEIADNKIKQTKTKKKKKKKKKQEFGGSLKTGRVSL